MRLSNGADVTFFNIHTGEKIGEMQTISVDAETYYAAGKELNPKVEINNEKLLFSRPFGGTLEFENATINKEALNQLFGLNEGVRKYTVVMEHNAVPKGKKLPKSKRIKKKYSKKHGYPYTTTIENVELDINQVN